MIGKRRTNQTGVPSLTKNAINDTDVFVTDYVEQKAIGEYFKNFDDMIKLHQQEIDRLVCVRKL